MVGGWRRGKFGKFSHSGSERYVTNELLLCVRSCKTGSAYISGYVVNSRIARAAS